MLLYIYHIFKSLRPAFSRETSWILGCSVILGLIGCSEMSGVSSLCRFWGLNEKGYLALLHFFQATSWKHDLLMQHWCRFALKQSVAVEEEGRLVLLGDHTLVAKDGRQMPGVVSLYQDSETQSKPGYFRGHCWGVLGLLVGSWDTFFCLPIMAQIQQGYVHLKEAEPTNTLSQRPVQLALDFAMTHQRPVWLILDAFFSVSPVFERAASGLNEDVEPWVEILTKAKKGYVAYPVLEGGQGTKITLEEVFETDVLLESVCRVYGKAETVSYWAQNLLWQGRLIRFIWVKNSLGRMILMSSDLTLEPVRAVELYCARMRIEGTFDRLKNLLKAFDYHFWTKGLPRHSRRPKKNNNLQPPETLEGRVAVRRCWRSYERFVALGCIALGILQLVALKYPEQVLEQFQQFLRTRPQGMPSERVVKYVLTSLLQQQLGKVSGGVTLGYLYDYFAKAGFLWQMTREETQNLCDSA